MEALSARKENQYEKGSGYWCGRESVNRVYTFFEGGSRAFLFDRFRYESLQPAARGNRRTISGAERKEPRLSPCGTGSNPGNQARSHTRSNFRGDDCHFSTAR